MLVVLAADVAPLLCTCCTGASWMGCCGIHNVPGIIAGALITLTAYLFKRHGEDKALARKPARSVRGEIAHILELLDDSTRTAIRIRPFATVDHISTDIYDGLLNSAAVSNFDAGLQDGLYNFYRLFKGRPTDEIQVSEEDLRRKAVRISEELDAYIRQKKSRLRFF